MNLNLRPVSGALWSPKKYYFQTWKHLVLWITMILEILEIFLYRYIFSYVFINKFLTKNLSLKNIVVYPIFVENLDFCPKFLFFTKIPIFAQYFDFGKKFQFLINISIFDYNSNFWSKGRFSAFVFKSFYFDIHIEFEENFGFNHSKFLRKLFSNFFLLCNLAN